MLFLNPTITIEKGKITTTTHQKPMNVYPYLTAQSNHSPALFKAIIYQLMKKYNAQNTRHSDFIRYTKCLYGRHLERGHSASVVRPYFLKAQHKLNQAVQQPGEDRVDPAPSIQQTNKNRPSYLHFEYHQNDILGRTVRRIYNAHWSDFEQKLGLSPPRMCYSRPKNIDDLTTQAKLHEPPSKPASYFMGEYQQGLNP